MTSALAQRIGEKIAADLAAEFASDPSTRPYDEHLITELSDMALALDSIANAIADTNARSPLADHVDGVARQARKLLAHVKGGERRA